MSALQKVDHAEVLSLLQRGNEDWAGSIAAEQPAYFETLAKGQSPRVLWFGCADSRTTPATILGNVELGEVFVHRNIANVLPVTDLSSLSVLTYAVGHLGVEHVVVCGHSQCGGVKGAISGGGLGILDHWLAPVKALIEQNKAALDAAGSAAAKEALVTKLNIEAGVRNLAATSVVQDAWRAGKKLSIHGFLFHIESGRLENLDVSISGLGEVSAPFVIKPAHH